MGVATSDRAGAGECETVMAVPSSEVRCGPLVRTTTTVVVPAARPTGSAVPVGSPWRVPTGGDPGPGTGGLLGGDTARVTSLTKDPATTAAAPGPVPRPPGRVRLGPALLVLFACCSSA